MTIIRRITALVCALALSGAAAAQEGKLKIATVDMQQLFKEYHRTNEAQKEINVERAKIQKDNNERLGRIRELDTELQNMRKQLEDPSIAEAKMVARMKGILEEIRKLVEEKAKAEDFDYVFDKSGLSTSQVPFFLYTKDATDITAVLLKELNKDAPKESTPSEPAPEIPATAPGTGAGE